MGVLWVTGGIALGNPLWASSALNWGGGPNQQKRSPVERVGILLAQTEGGGSQGNSFVPAGCELAIKRHHKFACAEVVDFPQAQDERPSPGMK